MNETYNAVRLIGRNTAEEFGLARSLSVMPGDEINMEVWAKYLDPDPENWQGAFESFLEQYASGGAPAGTIVDGGVAGSIGNAVFPYAALLERDNLDETAPKAFLTWLVFDRDFNPLIEESGFVQLGSSGVLPKENGTNVAHELLKRATPLKIKKAGYVYIYLSNENETPVEVFFDDFKVEHIKSPVVQMDDYYPFGLTFNSYRRENSIEQKYKYNGMEWTTDLEVEMFSARFRNMDPAIGRWWQLDPKPNYSISIYAAMDNNPIKYSDPLGDTIKFSPGVSKRFVRQFNRATAKLMEKGVGGLFNQLQKSKKIYTITQVKGMKGSYFNPKKQEFGWNAKLGMITNTGKTLSPATVLNHEFDHGAKFDRDPKGFRKDGATLVDGYGNKDEQRVIEGSEQRTAREMGEIGYDEVTRNDHFGTTFLMKNSTSTELDDSAVPTVTSDTPTTTKDEDE